MENIIKFIKDQSIVLILSFCSLLFLSLSIYLYCNQDNNNSIECPKENETFEDKIYVDVKGCVKKPGVYQVSENEIINNIIVMAGGFKKDAYVNNINLSKKVSDQLVIYVYTKSEFKKKNANDNLQCSSKDYDITNCISNGGSVINIGNETPAKSTEDNIEKNSIVNINLATKEELMNITGIGESKAINILNYRNEHGLFNAIEDIKNVSGIGESLFETIKNNITIE